MIGNITNETPLSSYAPSQDLVDLTKGVQEDYNNGVKILNEPYLELNDRSVITDENRGQMMFNAYVDTSVEDINEVWKWRGTRSAARNKGIGMHAQLTATFLLPLFTAQNEDDELDRDVSEVMQDVVEWLALPSNSNYQQSFLQIVFAMETNPVTFLGAEYNKIFQTIKTLNENGEMTTKEILDEVLSGFDAPIYSSSQVLISNVYERSIQRQKMIIEREYVEYDELEAEWGDHPNWGFVQAGLKSIYNTEDGLFYDIKDDDHPNLVAKEVYKNRREDSEIPFLGGIYMGRENLDENPIRHRDNRNTPKYNKVPFGFHRIGEHFFYYKSMMNSLGWDNARYDAMDEVLMNGALLEVEMPYAISGTDKVDSEIIFPNSVVAFEDPDTKITPLIPSRNFKAGFTEMANIKDSINEGSIDDVTTGQRPDADEKVGNVARAQAQAKKTIAGVGKSLAESLIQYADLMKDIALNHVTVPEIDELVGDGQKLKYRDFILENKNVGGKMMDKIIKFDESLIGRDMSEQEKTQRNLKLLEESGFPNNKKSIRLINPELFAKMKYLVRIDIDEMFTRSQEFMQPILLALKQQLANDPFTNQEALTRKIMYAFFQSDGEELIQDKPQELPAGIAGQKGSQLSNQSLNSETAKVVNAAV